MYSNRKSGFRDRYLLKAGLAMATINPQLLSPSPLSTIAFSIGAHQ